MSNPWWQQGVIYQIYPRSFQDTDGDGVGDLKGIELRLDYLAGLGVDAIWISPIYPSPMVDFGYDVADYCAVDPPFGTLEDFDRLLAVAHARGLKVILDFVPNHSSDQHPWFLESRTSRNNPKRDWFLWRDPALGGGPPSGAGSRQMYQSRRALCREARLSRNHGCRSEVWLGTRSSRIRSPCPWAAARSASNSSSEPKTGSTPV